uniref:Exostosin GT47 domain-containing protein n=1 Tax=Haptolina ericina TaxID=156174 RepID=A0A7S3AU11_9EUKA|mmetsp:Transcript_33105/g.74820  ORF Transcript_33105/g.74820 Transcript_33105/m.74820 type:complete len:192 (+) Transcript_33105:73-648(+)
MPALPRLAEALYYECVPILLSERMEEPFSQLLDWRLFSARMTEAQIPSLKKIVLGLDHAKLLRGVKLAKAALEYHVGAYDGADMLPLLLHQMHARLALGPPVLPTNVQLLHSDVETDRDYDANVRNDKTQCAHAVSTASVVLVDGVRWDCVSTDGYQAGCSTAGAADAAGRTTPRPKRCSDDLKVHGWKKL